MRDPNEQGLVLLPEGFEEVVRVGRHRENPIAVPSRFKRRASRVLTGNLSVSRRPAACVSD
jgi:hypothetical protein